MPIQTQIEKRFTKGIIQKMVHTHIWAIVLGLLLPALIYLFTILLTRSLLHPWPSVLAQVYEHIILFGWSGIYVFAMLFVLYPELNDLSGSSTNVFVRWLSLYGLGITSMAAGVILWFVTKDYRAFVFPISFGIIAQMLGWFGALTGFFRLFKAKKRFTAFDQLITIGIIPFSFSLVALAIAYGSLFLSGETLFSLEFRIGFRFLPMGGIGLILLAMLIRMSPEMLNWRPLDEQRLRNIYAFILAAVAIIASGYVWFHFTHSQPATLVYGLGAVLVFIGIIRLFSSLDFWMVKLLRQDTDPHIPFLYMALMGLIISVTTLLFFVGWEIMRGQALSFLWANVFTHLFFLGFIINGLMAMFLYVNNQTEGVKVDDSKKLSFIFAMLFWILLLRVIILPLMLILGWPGFLSFQWILDLLSFFAVFALTGSMVRRLSVAQKYL